MDQARRQRELSADELAETSAKAVDWIGDEPERGFSMALNRAADEADGATLIVTARDQAGALVGLLTLVPWGRSGVSLDVMRRSPEAPNGITEAMVAHVMEHAAELGVRRLSLNFCMFRTVYADNEALGVRPVNRLNYSVLGFLDRFWQFERLYRSNQKYDPEWVPRFACYDGAVAIVPVAIAAANAEGFLNWRPRFLGTGLPETRLEPAVVAEALAIEDEVEAAPSVRRGDQTVARVAKLDLLRAAGRDPCYPIVRAWRRAQQHRSGAGECARSATTVGWSSPISRSTGSAPSCCWTPRCALPATSPGSLTRAI